MTEQKSKQQEQQQQQQQLQNEEQTPSLSSFNRLMNILMNISIAGFGGALAGLSIARHRKPPNASTIIPKQRKFYVDHELPTTWAIACLSFASIVEFSKLVSPTSVVMDLVYRSSGAATTREEERDKGNASSSDDDAIHTINNEIRDDRDLEDICTVGDYTLGGAFAGAMFKGFAVRTRTSMRLASSAKSHLPPIKPKTGIVAGMIPGVVLGLIAGMAQVGLNRLQQIAEERLEQDQQIEEEKEEMIRSEEKIEIKEDEVEMEVKKMSMEEIKRQIEELKGKKS